MLCLAWITVLVLVSRYVSTEEISLSKYRYVQSNQPGFTERQKREIVDRHNLYRAQVIPKAGNMMFMKWNETLAQNAQWWSDKCQFGHGWPPRVIDQGQNLYAIWGTAVDTNDVHLNAPKSWHDKEIHNYDFWNNKCAKGKVCGHYIQMVTAKTTSVGCGKTYCENGFNNDGTPKHVVVCNYNYPIYQGDMPYETGSPCSLCSINSKKANYLCYNNSCILPVDCSANSLQCECKLECQNCGERDPNSCSCNCANGWDRTDCSVPCVNEEEKCSLWGKRSCQHYTNIQMRQCRHMCGECRAVGDRPAPGRAAKTCCSGKMCSNGYVLNDKCECKHLCPGPKCKACSASISIFLILFSLILNRIFY